MDEAKSYQLGVGVGREFANNLQIELVCAISMGLTEHLDESVSSIEQPTEIPDYVDDEQYRHGFLLGLRGRCGEIINRLDGDRGARIGSE